MTTMKHPLEENTRGEEKEMQKHSRKADGPKRRRRRTKKEKKICVTMARLSLPQSISLRNPQEMDAPVIPRETQRKEEEGRQPEIR